MELFDCCLNLTHSSFDKDRNEMLIRAYNLGIKYALVCGADIADSIKALELTRQYIADTKRSNGIIEPTSDKPQLYTTLGVHPHQAKTWNDDTSNLLLDIYLKNQDVVKAVGETGLDYARNYSSPREQKKAFKEQLELATKLNLPTFLHQRESHDDFFSILKQHSDQGSNKLVHCFTGTKDELLAYVELGCYIGITAWFCDERRGRHLAELVSLIPSDRLVLETDAPFLIARNLPATDRVSNKSNRNESAYLTHLLGELAKNLNKEKVILAQETLVNSLSFLQLPMPKLTDEITSPSDRQYVATKNPRAGSLTDAKQKPGHDYG